MRRNMVVAEKQKGGNNNNTTSSSSWGGGGSGSGGLGGGSSSSSNSIISKKKKNMNVMKMRKGLWSPEEDEKLLNYMMRNGSGCWSDIARNAGLQRCGKSCRLRWINYLRPDLKRGAFSPQEEHMIIHLHSILGNRWSQIAARLPGRTDNEIKNFWNSTIKKRLKNNSIMKSPSSSSSNTSPSPINNNTTTTTTIHHDQLSAPKDDGTGGMMIRPMINHEHYYHTINIMPMPSMPISMSMMDSSTSTTHSSIIGDDSSLPTLDIINGAYDMTGSVALPLDSLININDMSACLPQVVNNTTVGDDDGYYYGNFGIVQGQRDASGSILTENDIFVPMSEETSTITTTNVTGSTNYSSSGVSTTEAERKLGSSGGGGGGGGSSSSPKTTTYNNNHRYWGDNDTCIILNGESCWQGQGENLRVGECWDLERLLGDVSFPCLDFQAN